MESEGRAFWEIRNEEDLEEGEVKRKKTSERETVQMEVKVRKRMGTEHGSDVDMLLLMLFFSAIFVSNFSLFTLLLLLLILYCFFYGGC